MELLGITKQHRGRRRWLKRRRRRRLWIRRLQLQNSCTCTSHYTLRTMNEIMLKIIYFKLIWHPKQLFFCFLYVFSVSISRNCLSSSSLSLSLSPLLTLFVSSNVPRIHDNVCKNEFIRCKARVKAWKRVHRIALADHASNLTPRKQTIFRIRSRNRFPGRGVRWKWEIFKICIRSVHYFAFPVSRSSPMHRCWFLVDLDS